MPTHTLVFYRIPDPYVVTDRPESKLPKDLCFVVQNRFLQERKKPNSSLPSRKNDEDRLHEASGRSDMGNKKHQLTTNAAKPVQKKPSRKQVLLSNPSIKRWHDNLTRGSPITADQRLYRLDKFCKEHQITPMQLADLATRDLNLATNLLEDHITLMEEQGKSGSYVQSVIVAVKSWFENFDVRVVRKLKVANKDVTPSLKNERVPEGPEMAEMFCRADLRTAAIESFISKAGLRPQVLGNRNATDGLVMGDMPDIAIVQGIARCLQMPARVIVRRTVSKARHQYFTYLTSGGVEKVLAYLNDRLAKGDSLNADSPVIAPDGDHNYGRGGNAGKRFLTTGQITSLVRKSLRPRFHWRPYVLRAYFDTQLLIAESRGKIAHDFRVFFMGHKGSIEGAYTTNKGILAEPLLNEMRQAFSRSEGLLDLEDQDDTLLKRKEELYAEIEKTPLDRVQEILTILRTANPKSEGRDK